MPNLEVFTIAEQVAAHLRGEILAGRLQGLMPGRNELATELGFNGKTVEAALQLLEKEGLLVGKAPDENVGSQPPRTWPHRLFVWRFSTTNRPTRRRPTWATFNTY